MAMPRWENLTWQEIDKRRTQGMVGVLPAGSVEQHGPHLPTGTDVHIPVGLADRLATTSGTEEPVSRLVMLPPIYYTYARESNWWPGTLNPGGVALVHYTSDVVSDLFRQGVSQLVVLNGHLESIAFLTEGIQLALGESSDRLVILANWWELVSDSLIANLFGESWPGWEAEHAALTETSLMLALHPDKVRMERVVDDRAPRHLRYKVLPQPPEVRAVTGVFASARGASPEIGRRIADHVCSELLGILQERIGGRR